MFLLALGGGSIYGAEAQDDVTYVSHFRHSDNVIA